MPTIRTLEIHSVFSSRSLRLSDNPSSWTLPLRRPPPLPKPATPTYKEAVLLATHRGGLKRAREESHDKEDSVSQEKRPRTDVFDTSSPLASQNAAFIDVLEPTPTRGELVVDYGMQIISWDGRATEIFTDEGRKHVVGVLVGHPSDADSLRWLEDCQDAFEVIQSTLSSRQSMLHRRPLNEETKTPHIPLSTNCVGGKPDCLFENEQVQHICKFGSWAFEVFSERSYERMSTVVKAALNNGSLSPCRCDSALGVFPCQSIEWQTQPLKHDLSYPTPEHSSSWTSITALGNFDPRTGGHLVLWDLRIIYEFPPGSTVLLPSTLLRYSFLPIRSSEERCTIKQFAPRELFELQKEPVVAKDSEIFTKFDEFVGRMSRL